MRRVAVTGIGVLSPIGHTTFEVIENACNGRSGVGLLQTPFSHRLLSPLAATVKFNAQDHFDPPKLRMLDRVSQFALVAAKQALIDSGIDTTTIDRDRAGVFMGTAMGGSLSNDDGYKTLYGDKSDRIKPFTVLLGMHNAPATWIGIEYGLLGPNITYSTACSSSSVAIGEAWLRISSGSQEFALAGGSEAPLSFGSLKAWEALNTLAAVDPDEPSASCRPFAKNRSGMVIGEGAVMLVLEPLDDAVKRSAKIYGEVIGYGNTTDAGHITRPSVEGQANAMRAALKSASINTLGINAINAHGTGTQLNDAIETAAIKSVFGSQAFNIPISATKAIHGHLLGAAGALECALSLLAMQHNVALPTVHLHVRDADCDLDYVPNSVRHLDIIDTMLSNSFAFGGTNVTLVLRKHGNHPFY